MILDIQGLILATVLLNIVGRRYLWHHQASETTRSTLGQARGCPAPGRLDSHVDPYCRPHLTVASRALRRGGAFEAGASRASLGF